MSKVEIECSLCKSILGVDTTHAGKQARCPNCGGLTFVPYPEGEGPPPTDYAVPAPDAVHDPFKETFYQAPREEENFEVHEPQPHRISYPEPDSTSQPTIREAPVVSDWDVAPRAAPRHRIVRTGSTFLGVLSLFFAGLGFLSTFSCFCISPIFFAFGFSMAGKSTAELRTFGMLANGFLFFFWIVITFGQFFLGRIFPW